MSLCSKIYITMPKKSSELRKWCINYSQATQVHTNAYLDIQSLHYQQNSHHRRRNHIQGLA
jgi:hypothetical protein